MDGGQHSATGSGDPADQETEPPQLSVDTIFDILKNYRCRKTLAYLVEQNEQVDLDDLTEYIAIVENDTDRSSLTSSEFKRAYVALYQTHLPKMDEAGAIDFDRDRGIIELGPTYDQFEPYLRGPSRRWRRYYLWLAGITTALFVSSVVIGVFGPVPPGIAVSVSFAVTVLSFAVLALAHTAAKREAGDFPDRGTD